MKRIVTIFTLLLVMMNLSCQQQKQEAVNPLLTEWNTPYGVPPFDQIELEHYMPAFEQAMAAHVAEIEAITANQEEPTFENTILKFDDAGRLLEQVSLIFGMLSAADTNPEMQEIEAEVMPLLSAHSDRILLNEKLFARVRAVHDQLPQAGLNKKQERLVKKIYTEFVRSGALLEGEKKERLKAINEELSTVSVEYARHLLAENNAFQLVLEQKEMGGLPQGVRDQAREKAQALGLGEKFVFTLHKPSLIPFLTYSTDRALREKLYTAYLNRGNNDDENDNKQLINDFVRLRVEKANLLGYENYSAYVIANEMAGKTSAVYNLLDEIWTPAVERAQKEVEAMLPLFEKDHAGEKFQPWDWWYYAEKVRKREYSLDEEMLRPYFSLENVRGGIFFLANRLYGVTFRPILVPLYHEEVTAYEVLDQDQSHLGVLYFDFHPRDGKGQGAWCGNYVEQSYREGKRVAPVVSIVCNFTRPTASTPALLTLDETETLFHEFGHAMHFLLHDVEYRSLSEVEGDFVELPSQIMENWAFHPELLKNYALHYRTNDVIPQHLIEKLKRSEFFNQGFMTTELVAAALTDLDIHSITSYEPFDPVAFERNALYEQRKMIPEIEPRYRYPYFSHIFDGGYSAGYYFYIWAEVLDKDAFAAFAESGDYFNREIAARFRTLLESGGEKDGMSLYRDFRGADPDKRAMLVGRGLIEKPVEEPENGAENETAAETEKVEAVADEGWH
ncbi:MAG: M3 family metallopeptidase [Alistipes sp.]|nr:M3 family metallopeptidase [Alistipes sp.]